MSECRMRGVTKYCLFMVLGKMRNAESKMWNRKCGMMLIGQGDRPRDRCHSADYHTNLSTGNAVKCRPAVRKILATMPESVFDHEYNLKYLANVYNMLYS